MGESRGHRRASLHTILHLFDDPLELVSLEGLVMIQLKLITSMIKTLMSKLLFRYYVDLRDSTPTALCIVYSEYPPKIPSQVHIFGHDMKMLAVFTFSRHQLITPDKFAKEECNTLQGYRKAAH